MKVIDNRALLLNVRDPDRITTVIPKSKVVKRSSQGAQVLVHWGLEECAVLKNIGIKDIPSPILRNYTWPGIHRPLDHQKVTAAFLTMNRRAFCFNEQGTMKTSSAIWAADYLLGLGVIKKVLVICPLSIMSSAWVGDLFKTAMHRRVKVAYGAAAKRKEIIIANHAEFTIINFDGVEVVQKEIMNAGFDLIIVDEANAYKTTSSKRWKTFNALIKPNTWLWMMTGTPAAQSPEDAYGLAKLVNPDGVPRFFGAWRDRVMFKITNFRWVPKPDAQDTVHKALQPAIRYTKEECLDLPEMTYTTREVPLTSQQSKYYEQLRKHFVMQAAGEEVTAVHAASNMTKMLQICIAGDTMTLTDSGWKQLKTVSATDKLWDGVEWVTHSGLIYKGRNVVVKCFGVNMTPTHKVLTKMGWLTAQEVLDGDASERFNRAAVWLPEGNTEDGVHYSGEVKEGAMVSGMRLWEPGNTSEPELTIKAPSEYEALWVSGWGTYSNAWFNPDTPLQDMVRITESMLGCNKQGLAKLWGTGHNCLPRLGVELSEVLDRYVPRVFRQFNSWSNRQWFRLQQSELPVGNRGAASEQHSTECIHRDPLWSYDNNSSSRTGGVEAGYVICEAIQVQMAPGESANAAVIPVYDLLDCGPRNRFVVKGDDGMPLIVHNCAGTVYSDTGEVVEFDASSRMTALKEVIDESSHKVLVFIPYTHAIEVVNEELLKSGYDVKVINGAVNVGKRTDIFNTFQTTPKIKVLIIQPQAASHGVTLHAADTIVYWSPVMSVETYLQCNARVHRGGQKNPSTVIHLQGSALERKIYKMLQGKIDDHTKLIELYKEELK